MARDGSAIKTILFLFLISSWRHKWLRIYGSRCNQGTASVVPFLGRGLPALATEAPRG